jgi:hypothetical protein
MNTSSNNPNPPNAPDPLAVALAKLDPAPHGFEWNALMFAAGRASKARALLFWQIAACACALVACALAYAYFTRPTVATEHERIVYLPAEPTHTQAAPQLPAPVPNPNTKPDPKPVPPPEPAPTLPSVSEPSEWVIDPPQPGAAARWFNTRNEVLTIGLGVLPDQGRKVSAPREER